MARDVAKQRANAYRWRAENPMAFAVTRLRSNIKKYGLSVEDFALIALRQGFACAICRKRPDGKRHQRRLHVDHDHVTGRVRGLLCMNCNLALGAAQDDPKILRRMATYLETEA